MRSARALLRLHISLKPSLRRYQSTTDFGFKQVNAEEKEHMVKSVFTKVAQKYDIMNDFMSLGIHRLWKDEFVDMMGIKALKTYQIGSLPRHLDVAGGTGDIAFRSTDQIIDNFSSQLNNTIFTQPSIPDADRQIVVCDINPDMLAVGRDRASKIYGTDKSKMVTHTHTIPLYH